jgi:uncharacterized protein YbgA (DUF1722 family)/uncharacterized protein YbbK (DUF523 family)
VVSSACLELEACRWDGGRITFDFVDALQTHTELVSVCPEVEIGLGTPRDPVRLVRSKEGARLVQPASGSDLTESMDGFAASFLERWGHADGFVLKARSPSCGTTGVKIYDGAGKSSVSSHGPGRFAAAVLEARPDAAIEDEGRLRNHSIREHFLTKLYAMAAFREVERAATAGALVAFQARHKLTLMAYNQTAMRELGRICANPERRPAADVIADYRGELARAFRVAPRHPAVINVLEHAWGYVSDRVSGRESAFYRDQLRRYREGRIPLSGVTALLEGWAVRFGVDYLLQQAFFRPFPDGFLSVSDSGKGRLRRG